MARSQENSITMLLGLDRKVGEVVKGDDRVTVKITILPSVSGHRLPCLLCRQNPSRRLAFSVSGWVLAR